MDAGPRCVRGCGRRAVAADRRRVGCGCTTTRAARLRERRPPAASGPCSRHRYPGCRASGSSAARRSRSSSAVRNSTRRTAPVAPCSSWNRTSSHRDAARQPATASRGRRWPATAYSQHPSSPRSSGRVAVGERLLVAGREAQPLDEEGVAHPDLTDVVEAGLDGDGAQVDGGVLGVPRSDDAGRSTAATAVSASAPRTSVRSSARRGRAASSRRRAGTLASRAAAAPYSRPFTTQTSSMLTPPLQPAMADESGRSSTAPGTSSGAMRSAAGTSSASTVAGSGTAAPSSSPRDEPPPTSSPVVHARSVRRTRRLRLSPTTWFWEAGSVGGRWQRRAVDLSTARRDHQCVTRRSPLRHARANGATRRPTCDFTHSGRVGLASSLVPP